MLFPTFSNLLFQPNLPNSPAAISIGQVVGLQLQSLFQSLIQGCRSVLSYSESKILISKCIEELILDNNV